MSNLCSVTLKTTRAGTGLAARVIIQSGFSGVKDQRAFLSTAFDGNSGSDGTLVVNLPWSSIPGVGQYRFRIIDLQSGQILHDRYATVPDSATANYDQLGISPPAIDTQITSAQLASTISDETGTGALVFANTPTLVTPILGTPTSGNLTNCSGYAYNSLTSIPSTFPPAAHNQAWSTITSTPTTLSGYGITDAITAATAASTYLPLAGGTLTGALVGTAATLSTGLTIGASSQIYEDSGSLRIGTGTRTVYAGAIVLTRNLTGAGNAHGYDDNTTFAQTGGSAAYASFDARGQMTGANALDHYAGFQSDPTFSMSTTLARNYCFVSTPTISDGVLTDRYALFVNDITKTGDAVVTNNYGVLVQPLTAGATNNYAIYTAGATASYFGGTVTVGGLVTSTITPSSILAINGTTGITYSGSTLDALVEIGTAGTSGGSLVVHTPSFSSSFPSGLGVSGTWTLGTLTSLVNVTAYGVNSGGDFKSVMAFSTTLNGSVVEGFRLTSAGNVVIGSTNDTGTRLQVTGSITSTATVTGLNVTATSTVQGGNVFASGVCGVNSNSGALLLGASGDVLIYRDAANTLAQRNSTNAQTFRIYNTFTDASNYERAKIAWESNVLRIGTEKAGTGSARTVELINGTISNTGSSDLRITGTGTVGRGIQFTGESSTWSAFAGGSIINPAFQHGFCIFDVASESYRMVISHSNGPIFLNGSRLQLNGTTSSFPAIKRNAAALNFRLADDSADCDITAKAATFSGNVTVSAVNLVTDTTTGTKIGTATNQKLGFFDKTPVVQPTAVADATDAASVITQLNALLSRMRDLGLIAT